MSAWDYVDVMNHLMEELNGKKLEDKYINVVSSFVST